MKLHTDKLARQDVYKALGDAMYHGITPDVDFVVFAQVGSRKRSAGFELQLGTDDKTTGPTKSRRFKNSGTNGADSVWAATYDEWGWLIAHIFAADPGAIFGPYNGLDDFNTQTKHAYVLPVAVS